MELTILFLLSQTGKARDIIHLVIILACKTGVFARERYKMNDLCLSLK